MTESLLLVLTAAYSGLMRRFGVCKLSVMLCAVLLAQCVAASPKIHVITFGKWNLVPWLGDLTADAKSQTIKIRAVIIDGRIKEYAIGAPHEVTERLFVVRRAFRVNDSLPEESGPHWQWQRGGWVLIDRVTGRVSLLNLPEFDVYYSAASWYRDYVAYCGVAEDGKKTFAMVAQISRRKPVMKKPLSNEGITDNAAPDSACPAPSWQRSPVRVSFEPAGGAKETFAIRGHVVDVVNDAEEEEEGSR